MAYNKAPEKIIELLERHNQAHILRFWPQISDSEREQLLSQIEQLDFAKIDSWLSRYVKNQSPAVLPADFIPADSYPHEPKNPPQKQKYIQAVKLGQKLISDGKVAAFMVAGGQGTRLGFDGPKGDYRISPVKNKTLFRIFAETITAVSKRYSANFPWYIMTSPLNHQQTIDIFNLNNFYGLDSKNVFIFQQGTIPNFDFNGRILLSDKGQIAFSPDGHGGSLKALYKSGAIDDMKKRGIELISYWQVDNPLIKIFDPLFIGLHMLDNAEISSKAVIKNHPKEKVGNFCLVNGKVTVIEYSDLPDEFAEKTRPDGSLAFELGSIAIHIISRSFVERLNTSGDFYLPFHRAVKKIPYIDDNGRLINPEKTNGIKLEMFIFDALPLASKSVILQTVRAEEFAPVKNPTGVDSAEVTRKMMVQRAASWLESAGLIIPRKSDGSADCLIEIAPSFALDKDDVKQKIEKSPKTCPPFVWRIKPGDSVYLE